MLKRRLAGLTGNHNATIGECVKRRPLGIVDHPHRSVAALDSSPKELLPSATRVVAPSVDDSFKLACLDCTGNPVYPLLEFGHCCFWSDLATFGALTWRDGVRGKKTMLQPAAAIQPERFFGHSNIPRTRRRTGDQVDW